MDTEMLPAEMLPAGWIAYGDGKMIWGIGPTEEDAREDAAQGAAKAGCELDWSGVYYYPATAALLAKVAEMGGDVRWRAVKLDGRWAADVWTY